MTLSCNWLTGVEKKEKYFQIFSNVELNAQDLKIFNYFSMPANQSNH